MTNFFALPPPPPSPPQTFNSAKVEVLNRLTEDPPDNFKFGANLSHFILCLTDNFTMNNFLQL